MTENPKNTIMGDVTFDEKEVLALSPLLLAYIGDSVYDTFIRTMLLKNKKITVHKMHIETIKYVKAEGQANTLGKIMNMLTDQEKEIVRRGRNVKPHTVPKNADVIKYRYATGLEALIGYLFLMGQAERLNEILNACFLAD